MRGFSKLDGTPYAVSSKLHLSSRDSEPYTDQHADGKLPLWRTRFICLLDHGYPGRQHQEVSHPWPAEAVAFTHYATLHSRMMATPHDRPKLSFTATARQIVAEGGFKGYYRGLGPTLLRAFPVNASALWVYEGLMRTLGAEKVSSAICRRVKEKLTTRADAALAFEHLTATRNVSSIAMLLLDHPSRRYDTST